MTPRSLLLVLLTAASCAAPPRAPAPAAPGDLQPLEPGHEWVYEAGDRIQTRRVTGVERVGRFECRVLEARTGDSVERFWMRWDPKGLKVYRVSDGGRTVDFDDPLLLIQLPAVPGATWSFDERHGPVTLKVAARYEGDEEMSIVNRAWKCSRIRLIKRVGARVVVDQTCWYAREVGLVRMTVVVAGQEGESRTTLQLKSCNFLPE
ncbi:MAG TPA: hypothetical protein VFC90_12375 [Planctomycetota bacterium]|nr:hypothetical protein [Planctomycetota bacterium]